MADVKKETTWDRITGPKLFKTVTNWEGIHSVPLVPLRIMTVVTKTMNSNGSFPCSIDWFPNSWTTGWSAPWEVPRLNIVVIEALL